MLDTDTIGEYVTEIEKEKEAEAEKKKQKKWCLCASIYLYYIIIIIIRREINMSQIEKTQRNETQQSCENFLFILFTATIVWNVYTKPFSSCEGSRNLNYNYRGKSQSGVACFQ